jgi:hypothetical protein
MSHWYDKVLEEYHSERKSRAFYRTHGFQVLWRHVQDTIATTAFQRQIAQMRSQYSIPAEGFSTPESGSWRHPLEAWKHSHTDDGRKILNDIRTQLAVICREHHLLPRDWTDIIESYLFYNKLLLDIAPGARNLCFVADATTGKDGLGRDVDDEIKQTFPAALYISPYASERDVIDYVKKVFMPEIKRIQDAHRKPGVSIGKTRKRKSIVRKRNESMHQNRSSSDKKIAQIVRENHSDAPLKPGSINKTLSREKKRRAK